MLPLLVVSIPAGLGTVRGVVGRQRQVDLAGESPGIFGAGSEREGIKG